MDKNTKLAQYILDAIASNPVFFTSSCGIVNNDGTVNVKRENGTSVNAIAANITGSGDCAVFQVEGEYYAFSTSVRKVEKEAIAINRRSKKKSDILAPVFLLINDKESPQKIVDVSTRSSRHLTFSLGRYWTNIRIMFIQYSSSPPLAGDKNSQFTINYPGGSYQGEFNGLQYGDIPEKIDGICRTPIINCVDIDSVDKVLDVTWNVSFTDSISNSEYDAIRDVAAIILLRFSMPAIVTNGVKKTTISTFETEYFWSNDYGLYFQLAGGGCNAIDFLLDNKNQIYMRLVQKGIGAKIFTYSKSANFPLVNEVIETFAINKGLSAITVPSIFTGGKTFSFSPDNELFLKKKTIMVSGSGRIDPNYNPVPSPPNINRINVPINQDIYNLSQACTNSGVVIF
ncbi:MAG: hypothetical protein HWQ38_07985 [Nostoc sp. NMS7]|uniref:hypothetical protein n=1 Tax=Nostoc sp. NMS7 TaxID=2815391 RepID=UPI0025EF249F|nr:hypothetical protein [Nostoc sp. NMS7]MBN3946421.1 hypothetical protein [Nostoc sp. NMS7]